MRILFLTVRLLVALLFIFSGLVKANDPLGLAYKMQEFFEIWGWHSLDSFALPLGVLLNSFEIIAGVALVSGWAFRYVSWVLLLLILFFTGLTGYTYMTGMPKNCGCFGDCLPITAGVSFAKDVVLTLLIALLMTNKTAMARQDLLGKGWKSVVLATLLSFGLQAFVLRYLPIVDCLPYKEMASIPQGLTIPANAIPDSVVITFTYRKDGREISFTADRFPADFSSAYTFVKRDDKVVRKGSNNEPAIKGFELTGISEQDSTQAILETPKALLIMAGSVTDFNGWRQSLRALEQQAVKLGIPVFFVTAQPQEARSLLVSSGMSDIPVFSCDLKAIQTAARVYPTVLLLQKGVIVKKRSGYNVSAVAAAMAGL